MKNTKKKIKNTGVKVKEKTNRAVQLYAKKEKYKVLPSLAKTGVDIVAATAGGAIGAGLGYWSVLAGGLVAFSGHMLGDKTGLIKTVGLTAMVYGFAKGYENSKAASSNSVNGISLGSVTEGVKSRMIDFKDNLIHAFYLGKLIKDKHEPAEKMLDTAEIGSIALDEFDVYDDFAQQHIEQQALDEERRMDMLDEIEPMEHEIEEPEVEEDEEGYTEFEEIEPEVIDFNAM